MSDRPLLDRITEGAQAHHESTLNMQKLADEFVELTSRMRSMDEMLQANLVNRLDQPGLVRLPRAADPRPVPVKDLPLREAAE